MLKKYFDSRFAQNRVDVSRNLSISAVLSAEPDARLRNSHIPKANQVTLTQILTICAKLLSLNTQRELVMLNFGRLLSSARHFQNKEDNSHFF